jgi:putative hydrolase of the HAD superfamily
MKISAVCFDLGNVLISVDWDLMLNRLVKKSKLPKDEIQRRIFDDPQVKSYEVGAITTTYFLTHLRQLIEYKGTQKELRAAFTEIFTPMAEHIALAGLLRPHYPLALISNTNDAHITHAESTYTFFSLFSARIYSHQVKSMKPDAAIYQTALEALGGIDPLEALFIDDLEPNILGAVKLGWQTIHLRPGVDLREALVSYDLKGLDY